MSQHEHLVSLVHLKQEEYYALKARIAALELALTKIRDIFPGAMEGRASLESAHWLVMRCKDVEKIAQGALSGSKLGYLFQALLRFHDTNDGHGDKEVEALRKECGL